MEKFTSARSLVKETESNILNIAQRAKQDRQSGNRTIDCSVGVFLNDDRTLGTPPSVTQAIRSHICDALSYPKTTGSEAFRKAILSWYLKDLYPSVTKHYHVPFAATLGGTGAIAMAFSLYLEEGDRVLLPDIPWENYRLIAKKAGLKDASYPLFTPDATFDIPGLRAEILRLQASQKRILIVLNDPCQNPTGYCLSDDEYDRLFDMLDAVGSASPVTVLFDIAYLDYDEPSSTAHRAFLHLLKKERAFLPLFAASCSKTFGIYGMRVGALFSIVKNDEIAAHFLTSSEAFARGNYSCPNGPAIHCISALMKDPCARTQAEEEIRQNAETLHVRSLRLMSLLKAYGIPFLPYRRGFFITLRVANAYRVCAELEKRHTYAVPMSEELIRVAVSGISESEAETFVLRLRESIGA